MQTELVPAAIRLPAGAPRTPGVHVSTAIRCIAAESGVLDPKWVEELSLVERTGDGWWDGLSLDNQLRIAMGLAWEDWYMPTVEGVDYHPGELECEGIYLTPDGESVDVLYKETGTMGLICHECKSTYKSVKTVADLQQQWLWLWQLKAYCKAMGTPVAFLHVLFWCGDYSFPIRPVLKLWRITFTQAEIDENWDMIVGYVRHRQLAEREDEGLEGGV